MVQLARAGLAAFCWLGARSGPLDTGSIVPWDRRSWRGVYELNNKAHNEVIRLIGLDPAFDSFTDRLKRAGVRLAYMLNTTVGR